MKIRKLIIALFLLNVFVWQCTSFRSPKITGARQVERLPAIYPDYAGIVLPPNIAPANFQIKENGENFYVEISGESGKAIGIHAKNGVVNIPLKSWQKLLHANRGGAVTVRVFCRDKNGAWQSFQAIQNKIAKEPIESHLVYRLIKPLYVYWNQIGIYQRELASFKEKPIFLNRATGDNCVNCHSFQNHNPERFLLHLRAGKVGTAMLMAYDGDIRKIDTATDFNRAVAYRAWHPNGRLIAFSANTVNQFFHTVGENRDVYDKASDVIVYDVRTNTVTTTPAISSAERMETYPEWSPDGRHLYYCVTDGLQVYGETAEHPYRKIKYDFWRIPFDAESNAWGEPEKMLDAKTLGKSVTHPKVSPDGRWVLFCLAEYGNFSIYNQESDLYLLDTETKTFRELIELNSDKTESYHSWSLDGRWIVFSSKRENGLLARPYFSYVDKSGAVSKPFVLPQKDPNFYGAFLKTYNVPEFVNGPVRVRPQQLAKKAWDKDGLIKAKLDPKVGERQAAPEEPMWKPVQKGS